jgi:hypothetical protein
MHREVEQVAGDAVWLAVHMPSFNLFTPARRALSFSSIPWKRWRFGLFLSVVAPMINSGSATLTNVSSSVTPTISNGSMPLGAHALLDSLSVLA